MDSVIYDKPFKDYHELIELMRSRNIIVNDEGLAKEYLKHQITNEDYINGIGKNDLFATILILLTLTRGIMRNQLIKEITIFLESYKYMQFSGMTIYETLKLPTDFIAKLKNMK